MPASRPTRSPRSDRPGHAAAVDGARDRGSLGPDRRLRPRLRLHLHEHAVVADADDADADGDQPAQGVRADVRPRRQRRSATRTRQRGSQHPRRDHRSRSRACSGSSAAQDRDDGDRLPRRACARSSGGSSARSAEQRTPTSTLPRAPAGIPFAFEEHIKLMFDLLALAYQADITRVFTFMVAREDSNRTYPQVGVTRDTTPSRITRTRPRRSRSCVKIQTLPRRRCSASSSKKLRVDARRRRLAARPLDPSLRQQHEQQQRARSLPAAEPARRRGRRPAQGRPHVSSTRSTRR